jgi:hypothetical protein
MDLCLQRLIIMLYVKAVKMAGRLDFPATNCDVFFASCLLKDKGN